MQKQKFNSVKVKNKEKVEREWFRTGKAWQESSFNKKGVILFEEEKLQGTNKTRAVVVGYKSIFTKKED